MSNRRTKITLALEVLSGLASVRASVMRSWLARWVSSLRLLKDVRALGKSASPRLTGWLTAPICLRAFSF